VHGKKDIYMSGKGGLAVMAQGSEWSKASVRCNKEYSSTRVVFPSIDGLGYLNK